MHDATDPNVEALLAQLTAGREQLRIDKDAAKEKLRAADLLHRERARLHARTRAAGKRYLAAHRNYAAGEQQGLAAARRELADSQVRLTAEAKRLAAHHEHLGREADDYNSRLAIAWQSVAEAQVSLAADRRRSDEELAVQYQWLEARRSELAAQEGTSAAERRTAEQQIAALKADVDGLEARAANAQAAIADLNYKRNEFIVAQATMPSPRDSDWLAPVPIEARSDARSADDVLAGLHRHEAELVAERRAVHTAKAELAHDREQLADRQIAVNEQISRLAEVRAQWQQAEVNTVDDLEALARDIAQREARLAARTLAADLGDDARQQRDEQLHAFRQTLGGWQTALTAHEARFAAECQRVDAEVAARRAVLTEREASAGQFFTGWNATYAAACAELQSAIDRSAAEGVAMRTAVADSDRRRQAALESLAKLAARDLAAESVRMEFVRVQGPQAERRLQVLRKRWDARFTRYLQEIDSRREHAERAAARLTAQTQAYCEARRELTEQQSAVWSASQVPTPPREEEPIILSLVEARRDRELLEFRTRADALADALAGHGPADVIPLRRAG